jgi:uncharacterized protein YecT (DUF1311 family)
MRHAATALGFLLLTAAPAFAQQEFEPTAAERKTIGDCIEKTAGDSELKQMSECIGLVADPCTDAPGANTFSIVACNMREQKIWDDRLNEWYGEAQSRLRDDAAAATALKDAQRIWIQFRDATCGYWEKRYEGGTFASVATGNCTRIETGRRCTRDARHLRRPRSLVELHPARTRAYRPARSA